MDPSLKNLIPHEENLFPPKELLKVWGKGVFVGLFPMGFVFFFLVKRFLVFCKDKEVF